MRLRRRWPLLLATGSVLAALALPRLGLPATADLLATAAPLPAATARDAGAHEALRHRHAAAVTHAAPHSGALAGDFNDVALQGFGDRANSEAWSMAWFNNHLFVGTSRNLQCFKAAALTLFNGTSYPPNDPNLLCPSDDMTPTIQDLPPTLAAEVWALTPTITPPITQANWGLAYRTPYTDTFYLKKVKVTGPRDMGFRGMSIFTDTQHPPTLFISGVSMKSLQGTYAPPPALLGTTDGISFTAVPSDPGTTMGDINKNPQSDLCCLRDSIEYSGKFYIAITTFGGAGVVYVSSSPQDGDNAFTQFTPTNPVTLSVLALAVFNGHLYLGGSTPKGYFVWQTDGKCTNLPCQVTDFKSVVPPGGGLGAAGNHTVLSMQVFTDTLGVAHLYVGTDGTSTNQPTEVIRINADDSWDLIAGTPRTINGHPYVPLSELPAGFGWPYNFQMWRMGVNNGTLYIGTFDSSTAFTNSITGTVLQQLIPSMGFDLYATRDGTTFTRVTNNGFGDPFSWGARTFQDTPYGLFLGSNNLWYGLRVWQGGLSPSGEALAPQGLVAQRGPQNNSIALSWAAPSSAITFTVYRSTLTQQTVARYRVDLGALDPDLSGDTMAGNSIWTQSPDVPIMTTTAHSALDTSAMSGTSYFYYVVAQDAMGDLSEPSNEVSSSMARVLVPGLYISPPNGTVGSTATVTGTSFGGNETVNLYWDNTTSPLSAVTTTQSGAFTVSIVIPAAAHGDHNVIALGQHSGLSVTVPYFVMPSAVVSPTTGPVGTQATVSGLGFNAGDAITATWNGLVGPVLVTGTADMTGSFALTFTVPPAALGTYAIDVSGQLGGTRVTRYFSVDPAVTIVPASGTAGSTAAMTGTGFSAAGTVNLFWNCSSQQDCHGPKLNQTFADAYGGFGGVTVTIPQSATPGTYYVGAKDLTTGRVASTTYTVTG